MLLATILIVGTCLGVGCPAPGPCTLDAHQILCWDAMPDTPGLHYEVCAVQDGVIDLGCHVGVRAEFQRIDENGTATDYVLNLRYAAPVEWFDAAPHSMVTLTVRGINDVGPGPWRLMDIIQWPVVTVYSVQVKG